MSKLYRPNKRKPLCGRKSARYQNSFEDWDFNQEYTPDKFDCDWSKDPKQELPRKLSLTVEIQMQTHGTVNQSKNEFINKLKELKSAGLKITGLFIKINDTKIDWKSL